MLKNFFELKTYGLEHAEKDKLLTQKLIELTEFHKMNCEPYARFLKAIQYDAAKVTSAADIPFFPVRLFKEQDLLSIPREKVFKVMTSSGTTGQSVSKIYVDKETAMLQQKVMIRILSDYIGNQRIPILVIDTPAVMKDRKQFTARGAAIIGMQVMAREMTYALNDEMMLDFEVIEDFLHRNQGRKYMIFGFTFLVWQHFYKNIINSGKKYNFSDAWLMTGGGWKKLVNESVTQEQFQKQIKEELGIEHFLDHYGMVEQTGCIYAECECHNLHASIYSDVFVRRAGDFSLCEIGEEGIIQTVSVLPHSYPGHSLLTEDRGIILGEDDCPCGRKGKYVKIIGRLPSAELRGCSDTYAAK